MLKSFILISLLVNIMFIMGSDFWFMSWFLMELNSFLFIPLLSNYKFISKLNMWKYFFIQGVSSILFLISMFLSFSVNFSHLMNHWSTLIMYVSMMMKMGMPPFHKWLFEISQSISWGNFLILSTFQKVPPVMIMSSLSVETYYLLIISLISLTYSIVGLFNWSMRQFLLFSSISNMSWIIILILIDSTSMLMYFLIYCLNLSCFTLTVMDISFCEFSSINRLNSKGNYISRFTSLISVLSMMGIPPLAGFFIKYDSILSMMDLNMNFYTSVLVIISSIMVIGYLFFILIMLMNYKNSYFTNGWYNSSMNYLMYFLLCFIQFFLIYFYCF
uniref:NADH dehydrogenase subunit 2 n=1 Tax=Anatoecus icterodes TaxID=1195957 RepID=UPI00211EF9BD|nr:NADH dehydrogenase subunit 2 [Anatoecus icterodes]YP_010605970.1 NADH dehydrogenase subunit 2 [Anatoecus dentatus]UTT72538.1 NADH dehydrogenase subunit 2 [Anatoecus icterodes]WAN81289.1 NADH dehydrogenase subunit 2 [Anatoecus dentatus]